MDSRALLQVADQLKPTHYAHLTAVGVTLTVTSDREAHDETVDFTACYGDSGTVRFLVLSLLVAACGGGSDASPREVHLTTTIDASGLSPALDFTIPDRTRSITVVVHGDNAAL